MKTIVLTDRQQSVLSEKLSSELEMLIDMFTPEEIVVEDSVEQFELFYRLLKELDYGFDDSETIGLVWEYLDQLKIPR